jgi:hypothetical protein
MSLVSNAREKILEVLKKKKEIMMRHTLDAETDVKEFEIGTEDTVSSVFGRLDITEHMAVDSRGTDAEGNRTRNKGFKVSRITGDYSLATRIQGISRFIEDSEEVEPRWGVRGAVIIPDG